MALKWNQVVEKEEYKILSDEHKGLAKEQYFDSVVAPNVPKENLDMNRQAFFDFASGLDVKSERPSYLSNVYSAAKKTLGVGMGVLNSPLAYVWGSQAAKNIDPDQYTKLPWHEQQLVSIGGGLMSAWEGISEEGRWGTLYGDYYKSVRGKTIEEDLPDKLKWAAPTLEMFANIISDPVISIGEARNIANLRLPKSFIKDVPKQVYSDLKRFSEVEEGQKIWAKRILDQAEQDREPYAKWWSNNLDNAEQLAEGKKFKDPGSYQRWWEVNARGAYPPKTGRPLLTPEGRGVEGVTTPQNAMMGQPKREFATQIERQVPEISQKIEEAGILGKLNKDRGEIGSVIAKRKMDEFNKKMGLPPVSGIPKGVIKQRRAEATLTEVNAFRTNKGLEPISKESRGVYKTKGNIDANIVKSSGGALLGIEEDENGNIVYNPGKGLAGTLAVAGGVKFSNVNKNRFTRAMNTFPSWNKVHGMVGKEKRAFEMSGLFGKFYKNFLDRFEPLKKGGIKAYEAARTFSSYKDQAGLKFDELREGFKNVKDDAVIMSDYIDAHRALNRAERGLKNPNGVTYQDAKKAIKEIETYYKDTGKDINNLKDAFGKFQKWTHDYILKEAFDSGIISKEAYTAIVRDNRFYATFDVLDKLPPDIHNLPAGITGEYFSVGNQNIIKGMVGTERKIADPIEATIRKFMDAQGTYAKNKVASALVDDPIAKELLRPVAANRKQFSEMRNKGFDPIMQGAWNEREFGTINRFKDGNVERYIAPKEIADTMKQLSPAQVPKVIAGLNNLFRKTATSVYLPFTISNAMRDALMAYTTAPVYRSKDIGKFAKDWGKGFWEGAKHEFGGKSDIAKKYINAGGGFGWAGNIRSAKVAKKELFKKGILQKSGDVIMSPFKLIEKISSTIELAPRLGTFDAAKMAGLTSKDAALMARQSTIDFNRAGVYTKVANQFVPFLAARVGGRLTIAQSLKRDPKGTLAKAFTSTVIPGMGAYAWNRLYHSDLYDDIPEHIRQNYFTIIIGTDKDAKGKVVPKYLVISKGDLGQMSWNPIEFGIDKMWKKDREGTAAFLVNYLSDLSPVELAREGKPSLSKAAGGLLPPIVKGAAENWANLNFYTGREIVPYYMGKTKPPELQYRENTPAIYKALGKKIGISPLKLQNFASNIVAGYGREGLDPSAMWRGLTGRMIKTTGGEIQDRAWTAIKDIEQGYVYTRAYAQEMIKNGDQKSASALMTAWNTKIFDSIKEFNAEFEKYGIKDKGGLLRSYRFSVQKRRNLSRSVREDERHTPLERRLMRRMR